MKELGLEKNVEVKNWIKREEAIEALNKSSIGLLINTKNNEHSVKYTSPLKYFEYIYGKLKVVATNYPAHIMNYLFQIRYVFLKMKMWKVSYHL